MLQIQTKTAHDAFFVKPEIMSRFAVSLSNLLFQT